MDIRQSFNRNIFLVVLLSVSLFSFGGQTPDFRYRTLTIEDGLRSNTVRNIVQDPRGFIWLGTDNGLCRYDGYNVAYYPILQMGANQYISTIYSLSDGILVGTSQGAFYFDYRTEVFSRFIPQIKSEISSFSKDRDGNIWIATMGQGGFCFNLLTHRVRHFAFRTARGCVSQIFVDSENRVWAVLKYGRWTISRLNKTHNLFQSEHLHANFDVSGAKMLQTRDRTLWLGTWNEGLFCIKGSHVIHVLDPAMTGTGRHIHTLVEMPGGKIYLGCDDGVIVYDIRTGKWNRLILQGDNMNSIDGRFAYSILRDREGGIWIGTFYDGVKYISPIKKRFLSYTSGYDGFKGNVVSHFCEDYCGHVWIGSDDGGLSCLDEKTGRFINYAGSRLLSSYNVHALCISGTDLWIGTYTNGVICMNLASGRMKRYAEKDGLDSKSCYAIYKDHLGRLWLSTMGYGIFLYDRKRDRFHQVYKTDALVMDIDEDRRGNMWFCSQGAGLYRYNPFTRKWKDYRCLRSSISLPSDQVDCLEMDEDGRLWIGTMAGLCCYNPSVDNFHRISLVQDSTEVSGIISDHGILWLATTSGILRYEKGKALRVFNRYDGLCCEVFRPNTELKTLDGCIFFGGVNGFTAFYPYRIRINRMNPPVFITGLEVYNKQQKVGSRLLPEAVSYIHQLDLQHDDKMFSLSFSSLSYCSPGKNHFAYKLDGFDKEWNYVGNCHHATYTNLPSGIYTFRVKATNNDGVWSRHEAQLKIIIHPPFWWSLPAKIFYICLILFLIYEYTHFRLQKAEKKHRNEIKTLNDRKNLEIRESRLKFFTMIAHEIRTPVTLIMGPLEQLMSHLEAKDEESVSNRKKGSNAMTALQIIDRNAQRLLYLVNQLLDFSKGQRYGFQAHFKLQNIGDIMESVVIRFQPFFKQKGINFHVDYPPDGFSAIIDPEGVTKVISNLMMNALKYTKDRICLSCIVPDDLQSFQLMVSDNGIGISKADQSKVFNAFYQVQDNTPGAGIGLAIVKSIVDLHHGQMKLDSEPNKGTKFIITFPVNQSDTGGEKMVSESQEESGLIENSRVAVLHDELETLKTPADGVRSSVLIVEDDADMRSFLASDFRNDYVVYTASNGVEGINVLSHHVVTLIVSDWMMPEMDGAEFCRHIRADQNTSHIPFIMLTAKTDNESKAEGMNCGADAYIEKPFSVRYLNACISNLINMRKLLMKKFSDTPSESITQMARTPLDNDFLLRMNHLIEENMDNADLSVNFIAEQMNISRSSLFAKIKSLADVTPNEMIQVVRLRRAAQLLKEGKYRVSEVCFMVGFNSPSYFSKCFQKQFGVKPTEYK